MNTKCDYMTSYRAGHRFIPNLAFYSNVSSLDTGKASMPNAPNLKQWNYDTTTNTEYGFKYYKFDPMQRSTRVHFNQLNYIIPQWEKYGSNPPKPMNIPQTEYTNKYIQPKLVSNVYQTQIPITCVQPKLITCKKEIATMQTSKVSDMGVIRKMDPYVSTQKLAYIEINPVTAKQINAKYLKREPIVPKHELFYNEPIFNRKNNIRVLPNTIKFVPHNALRSEKSVSFKTPINTLSKFDGTVEMPISVSKNPTLAQILSVPRMYTSEYSKIGINK